jgi:TRAP-type C4-dicarboxylate transport system substrate-binding protein
MRRAFARRSFLRCRRSKEVVEVRRSSLVILLLVAAGTLAGCAGSAANKAGAVSGKPTKLVLADCENDASNVAAFVSAVRRLSKGNLEAEVRQWRGGWRGGALHCEGDLVKDVEAGKAPMGVVASRAFDTVGVTAFEALQAPFLIDSLALERRVLESDAAGEMLAELRRAGLVGLVILPGPLRRPVGFGRPLRAPSDFRRVRIGIKASRVSEAILRALGAVPVTVLGNGDRTGLGGLESHVMGVELGPALPNVFVTGNVDFEPRPNVIVMNRRAFQALSASQRTIILHAAAMARTSAGVYEPDAAGLADICRRGVKIVAASEAELRGLRAAERPVYQSLESNPQTRAFMQKIRAMQRAPGNRPDAVQCPRTGAAKSAATSASALDGTWAVTYTRKEFRAAGAYADEVNIPANWGHFTLTFHRGHFFDNGTKPNGSGSGTFVVRGDKITFYRHDHAYPGSDTEIWGPYIWSVYRDTLTFKKVSPLPEIPTSLVVKPWRRIRGG